MALWFNYKELAPDEPNPPSRLKPKPKRTPGRPRKPEPPHLQADRDKKPYFTRNDLIRRVAEITGVRSHTCRLFVNAALAAILSEVELGHDVEIPGIGRIMFEEVDVNRYKFEGLWYIRHPYKKPVFSFYESLEHAVQHNTRQIDWSDPVDPRINRVFAYKDAKS